MDLIMHEISGDALEMYKEDKGPDEGDSLPEYCHYKDGSDVLANSCLERPFS